MHNQGSEPGARADGCPSAPLRGFLVMPAIINQSLELMLGPTGARAPLRGFLGMSAIISNPLELMLGPTGAVGRHDLAWLIYYTDHFRSDDIS